MTAPLHVTQCAPGWWWWHRACMTGGYDTTQPEAIDAGVDHLKRCKECKQ